MNHISCEKELFSSLKRLQMLYNNKSLTNEDKKEIASTIKSIRRAITTLNSERDESK